MRSEAEQEVPPPGDEGDEGTATDEGTADGGDEGTPPDDGDEG